MKYKVGKSKIQGKGLIVKKPIKKGERIGLAHVNGQPTSIVGKYHNHEDEPTAVNIKEGNKRYLIADRDLIPGDEITTNYRLQPELEQPENFKHGGETKLPKMPKPSKKGVLAKGYSRSLEATNKVFTENSLFEKPKSKKHKVFDPNANYQEGGITSQEEIDAGNNAMMKARLAYADMHGNPAAKRMVVAPDQPYQYTGDEYDRDWNMPVGVPEGSIGTHYLASFGNYAVPFIQQGPSGLYFNELPTTKDKEAIRFDNEADAEYFGGHYKEITPDESYRQDQDNFIETELTPEEIHEYRKGGYIVEEIDEPTKYQDGGVYTHPARPGSKYIKRSNGWYVSNSGTGNSYVKIQDPTGARTKELDKSAVLTDEKNVLSPAMQKYLTDTVPLNKQQVSESTDTQHYKNLAKSIGENKLRETAQGITAKQNMRDAYRQHIQTDKSISAEEKQRLLSDFNNRNQTEQNETAYLALNKDVVNPDKVKPLTAPLGASNWDILTNPYDAFKASVVYGDYTQLPRNYNDAKMAGVNMTPRSYNERFNYGLDGQGGSNMVGNVLNYNTNLLDAGDKVYKYARKGDKFNATLNLLRFAPLVKTGPGEKVLRYLDEVGEASDALLSKTPLNAFTKNSSSDLVKAVGKTLSPNNVLKARGMATGLMNLPSTVNSGLNYYQTGNQNDLVDFGNKSLSSFVSLAPFGGSKVLQHVDPFRTAYFGVNAGLNLMKKPEEGLEHLPSLFKSFNIRKEGGSVDAELTDEQIQDLLNQGYIIEELD